MPDGKQPKAARPCGVHEQCQDAARAVRPRRERREFTITSVHAERRLGTWLPRDRVPNASCEISNRALWKMAHTILISTATMLASLLHYRDRGRLGRIKQLYEIALEEKQQGLVDAHRLSAVALVDDLAHIYLRMRSEPMPKKRQRELLAELAVRHNVPRTHQDAFIDGLVPNVAEDGYKQGPQVYARKKLTKFPSPLRRSRYLPPAVFGHFVAHLPEQPTEFRIATEPVSVQTLHRWCSPEGKKSLPPVPTQKEILSAGLAALFDLGGQPDDDDKVTFQEALLNTVWYEPEPTDEELKAQYARSYQCERPIVRRDKG